MSWVHTPIEWTNGGTEPSTAIKASGFEAGYKPPASYFNYIIKNNSDCIDELQQAVDSIETGVNPITANTFHFDENHTIGDFNSFIQSKTGVKLLYVKVTGKVETAVSNQFLLSSATLGNQWYFDFSECEIDIESRAIRYGTPMFYVYCAKNSSMHINGLKVKLTNNHTGIPTGYNAGYLINVLGMSSGTNPSDFGNVFFTNCSFKVIPANAYDSRGVMNIDSSNVTIDNSYIYCEGVVNTDKPLIKHSTYQNNVSTRHNNILKISNSYIEFLNAKIGIEFFDPVVINNTTIIARYRNDVITVPRHLIYLEPLSHAYINNCKFNLDCEENDQSTGGVTHAIYADSSRVFVSNSAFRSVTSGTLGSAEMYPIKCVCTSGTQPSYLSFINSETSGDDTIAFDGEGRVNISGSYLDGNIDVTTTVTTYVRFTNNFVNANTVSFGNSADTPVKYFIMGNEFSTTGISINGTGGKTSNPITAGAYFPANSNIFVEPFVANEEPTDPDPNDGGNDSDSGDAEYGMPDNDSDSGDSDYGMDSGNDMGDGYDGAETDDPGGDYGGYA